MLELSTPFEKFPEKFKNLLLYGEAGKGGKNWVPRHSRLLKQSLEDGASNTYRDWLLDFMSATRMSDLFVECACAPESLAVKVNSMSIAGLHQSVGRSFSGRCAKDQIGWTGRTHCGRIVHESWNGCSFE